MTRPFDASLKELITQYPADWLPLVGHGTASPIEVIDAEISTISAAVDKVLLVQDNSPWLLHLELQSGPKSGLGEQLHWYNSLLRHRHNVGVRTTVVLLRKTADSPKVTGQYQEKIGDESPYLEFRFGVVRVWEQPVETILTGGLGTLPLAPISAVAKADLPEVVQRMDRRLAQEATRDQAVILGAASYLLTGLRLPPDETRHLFQGVHFMSIVEDSSAYQIILEEGMEKGMEKGRVEGAIEELRKTLLRLGSKRFGPATEAAITTINASSNLEHLEQLSDKLLDAGSWQELLGSH